MRMRAALIVILCLALCRVAAAQLQTLDPTDSLGQRRTKTNANFLYHQNLIVGMSATQHAHTNQTFLDALPSSVPASGSFLKSNGTSIVGSTDGSSLTALDADSLASGEVPEARLGASIPRYVDGHILRVGPGSYNPVYDFPNSGYLVLDKTTVDDDASVVFRNGGAARAEIGIVTDDDIHFKTVTGSYGSEVFTDRMTIKTSGEVVAWSKIGIGTIPVEYFHVGVNSPSSRLLGKIENTNTGAGGRSSGLQLAAGGVNWLIATDEALSGSNSFFIHDLTAGQTRFSIATGGEIKASVALGVGTTPVEPLHIAKSVSGARVIAKVENTNTGAGSRATALQLAASGTNWTVGTDAGIGGGNNFFISDDGAGWPPRLIITSAGLVALGDVTSSYPGFKRDGAGIAFRLADDSGPALITSGAWNGTEVGAQYGGTGINTSSSTGVPLIASGTWSINAGISHLASSTSASLAGVLSDETGSGSAVFHTSPTFGADISVTGSSTTELQALKLENGSAASNTTKSATIDFRARDTAATLKGVAKIATLLEDANAVTAGLAFSTRTGDATAVKWTMLGAGYLLSAGLTFATLGTPANGAIVYCSDCTFANPCAGSGTGAIAKRLNGAWRCD